MPLTSKPSKADLTFSVEKIFITSGHTSDITLINDLTVRTALIYGPGGGELKTDGLPFKLIVQPNPGLNATPTLTGPIDASAQLDFKERTTTSILGAQTKLLKAGLSNSGTIAWANGDIELTGTLANNSTGVMTISGPRTLGRPVGVTAKLVNAGSLYVDAGPGATATIGTELQNLGYIQVATGTADVFGPAVQELMATATTYLAPGTTLKTHGGTYIVKTGLFHGNNATVEGFLRIEGGIITAATQAWQPATLTIKGAYTQQAGATMQVYMGPQGFSTIDVQTLGGNFGSATLAGKVKFVLAASGAHHGPGTTPAGGVKFLSYLARNGNFNQFEFPNNAWWAFGAWHQFNGTSFDAAPPGDTEYRVNIT